MNIMPDYNERLKDLYVGMDEQLRRSYLYGDPSSFFEQDKYAIAKQYLDYEAHCEERFCSLDTPHGPMPANRWERSEYMKRMNEKEKGLCYLHMLTRTELNRIVKEYRDYYEKEQQRK